MEAWIIAAFSIALVVIGSLVFSKSSRVVGTVSVLLGISGLAYLAYTRIQEIPLPEFSFAEISWTAICGLVALTLVVVGLFTDKPQIGVVGLGFGVGFLYLVLAPSWWFLLLGLLAVVAIMIYNSTEYWIFITIGALLVAATSVVGYQTSATINSVKEAYNAIVQQLANNNKKFAGYEQMCLDAEPGSATATICIELNSLRDQVNSNTANIAALTAKVDANTTAIQTLTGQVATVTEQTDAASNTTTIQSDPSTDETAAAALAKELVAAGWGPDDFSVNSIDQAAQDGVDQGNYAYGDPILNKSRLVEVLNGTNDAETAIRDRVTSAVPESERARLLSGEGYYAIQFKRPVCLGGSDYYKDGVAHHGDGERVCYDAGDVSWVYVASDGTVYWGAAVRGKCNNPHYDTAPARQDSPQAELCPEGTDRAGQMVGSGCNYPDQPDQPTGGQPGTSVPSIPPSSPPTTAPPTTGSTTPTTSTPTTSTTTTHTPTCEETGEPCGKTGSNPAITASESHSVNYNDGATDSQGIQNDPAGDAEAAASAAASSNASQSAAASSSAAQADTDSGGGSDSHGQAPVSTSAGAPTGAAGENTGGDVWDTTG